MRMIRFYVWRSLSCAYIDTLIEQDKVAICEQVEDQGHGHGQTRSGPVGNARDGDE